MCLIQLNQASGKNDRDLSLTDWVLRAVLADPKIRVDAILTFNKKEFADVCRKYNRWTVSERGSLKIRASNWKGLD